MTSTLDKPVGHLAYRDLGLPLAVTVLRSGAGYYLGTLNDEGPVSRESAEYFRTSRLCRRWPAAVELSDCMPD